jgi:WhiB family redox-sensing transcriptional regulator
VDLSYFELIEVPGDWRMQALCPESDLDFFPSNLSPQVAAPLKEVCAQCPSQQQCLDFAIINGEKYGLYGGLTPPERRALVKSGYVPVSVEVK